jgi:hypothetical protein
VYELEIEIERERERERGTCKRKEMGEITVHVIITCAVFVTRSSMTEKVNYRSDRGELLFIIIIIFYRLSVFIYLFIFFEEAKCIDVSVFYFRKNYEQRYKLNFYFIMFILALLINSKINWCLKKKN